MAALPKNTNSSVTNVWQRRQNVRRKNERNKTGDSDEKKMDQSASNSTDPSAKKWNLKESTTVISGGQVGADQGGLMAAKQFGIKTKGYAPFDYMTSNGNDYSLKDKYNIIAIKRSSYPKK